MTIFPADDELALSTEFVKIFGAPRAFGAAGGPWHYQHGITMKLSVDASANARCLPGVDNDGELPTLTPLRRG